MSDPEYDEDLYEEALERLSTGERMDVIFNSRTGIGISKGKFMGRLYHEADFYDKYQRAMIIGSENMLDEMVTIADISTVEDVPLSKLRIDTRKIIVSRLDGMQKKSMNREAYSEYRPVTPEIPISEMSQKTREAYVEFMSCWMTEKSDLNQGEE